MMGNIFNILNILRMNIIHKFNIIIELKFVSLYVVFINIKIYNIYHEKV